MQARAIFRAVTGGPGAHRRARPRVEIMIPLVAYAHELELARELILRVAVEEGFPHGHGFQLGTMIELPRACFARRRDRPHAEFFSFGTNDLTQTGLGFSRDDIEARSCRCYSDYGILERSPFEHDRRGGRRRARAARRRARPRRAARPRGRHLRRARRRPAPRSRFFHARRPRLRQLLAVPRADRARRGRPGRDRGRSTARSLAPPIIVDASLSWAVTTAARRRDAELDGCPSGACGLFDFAARLLRLAGRRLFLTLGEVARGSRRLLFLSFGEVARGSRRLSFLALREVARRSLGLALSPAAKSPCRSWSAVRPPGGEGSSLTR